MATQKAQRIGIWIIAIVLTIGTLASFIAIVLAPKNQATDQAKLADLTNQYQASQDEYQKKADAQTAELSKLYFDEFNQYSSRPAAFNKADVTKLTTNDLKIGTGTDITADSTFSAYYIGWNPNGEVFDGSIDGNKLKAPITVEPGGVIEGWTEGVVGMKVGGVRELSIPSDKAYKDQDKSEQIPPNTPLKFIIMIIPTPDTIPEATIPPELLKYYTNGGHF
jgi:FKBP-type peptidyl-prolyl cis-trans isomerase